MCDAFSQTERAAPLKRLVIGVGSPFAGDRAGWEAVRFLRAHRDDGQTAWSEADRPGAVLLERMRGYGQVVVIDAMQSGAAPGTVRRVSAGELAAAEGLLSNHGFGVAEAIALGATLGMLPERLEVIGIEADADDRFDTEALLAAHDALSARGA